MQNYDENYGYASFAREQEVRKKAKRRKQLKIKIPEIFLADLRYVGNELDIALDEITSKWSIE